MEVKRRRVLLKEISTIEEFLELILFFFNPEEKNCSKKKEDWFSFF